MADELERIWKEPIFAKAKLYPGIDVEEGDKSGPIIVHEAGEMHVPNRSLSRCPRLEGVVKQLKNQPINHSI
jgi:hypothetical protein